MEIKIPQSLVEAYVVANTPAYLYKAIRFDPYVIHMTNTKDEKEIADYIERFATKGERNIYDVVAEYCALIAFFLKDSTKQAEMLRVAEKSKLPWALPILSLAKDQKQNNNMTNLDMPSIVDNEITGSHISSSNNFFTLGN